MKNIITRNNSPGLIKSFFNEFFLNISNSAFSKMRKHCTNYNESDFKNRWKKFVSV